MAVDIGSLADRCERLRATTNKPRVVIVIAGIPGAGKTTIAQQVAAELNLRHPGSSVVVGMDGYHYTRAQLDAMDDPVRAHRLRGAPFTFDAQGVVELSRKLGDSTHEIKVPTFDHAAKDPVDGGLTIAPEVQYVLFEGLYLLLNIDPWQEISKYADESWFVAVDEPIARDRLARRHVQSGITDTLEAGYERADFNDLPNGRTIVASSVPATLCLNTNPD